MGMMCPPQSVKRCVTPSSLSARATWRPPCRSVILPPAVEEGHMDFRAREGKPAGRGPTPVKAVRYHKPKDVRVDDVQEPRVEEARDAVIRVTSTAICGSDLHIYNGLVPQLREFTLGHEFMGIVESKGDEVTNLEVGDRVIVPYPIADGTCWFCRHGLPTQCENSNPMYGPE